MKKDGDAIRREPDGRWPLLLAGSLLLLAGSAVAVFHPSLFDLPGNGFGGGGRLPFLLVGLVPFLVVLLAWYRSAASEAGGGPLAAARVAMLAFILSEVMFFAAFFAAYLQFAIFPGIAGLVAWPPADMRPPDPWGGPLLNTAILLTSGAAVALAHSSLLTDRRVVAALGFAAAILLGIVFLALQIREFTLATQSFDDGVYPSIFFLATGFHGLHVLIGVCLLTLCLIRVARSDDAPSGFVFDAAAWYWHFVDAVWLLLFAVFYAWAG